MTIGEPTSIVVGVATAHCRIGMSALHGYVVGGSDKAVEIRFWDECGRLAQQTVWFSRRARVRGQSGSTGARPLVPPDAQKACVIDRYSHHSVLSA